MKKLLITIVTIVVALIAASIGGMFGKEGAEIAVNDYKSSIVSEKTKVMMEVSSELNKVLPMMIDKDTQAFSTSIVNGDTLQYNYKFVNLRKDEVDTSFLISEATKNHTNFVCSSPDMKFLIKNNISVNYAYYGKNHNHITTIFIDTKKCN
tara:strand:- start:89 stop:541 length:453 start_codon:yes stop_codon:yes gene_type:complete